MTDKPSFAHQAHAPSPNVNSARKEHIMTTARSLLLALIALFTLSFASANTHTIYVDDGRFDYSNTDLKDDRDYREAYLQLAINGEGLKLTLSEYALEASLPSIKVSVPKFETTDFNGYPVGPNPEYVKEATLSDIGKLELVPFGNAYRGFRVVHPQTTLHQIETAYVTTFENLGFTVSSRDVSSPNGVILVFENGTAQLQAVLHRNGSEGISVRIHN